ncbi:hypothetical protein CG08_1451 [Riemerella anatipestifer]|nr:hypothetical protein CG08_1451 [Riemerella anatipestifer]
MRGIILNFVNMNVKLRVLTAGAVFFIGAQSVVAQKTKKTLLKLER